MTPNDRASRRRRNTVTITSVAIAAVTIEVFGISEYSPD